jgi:MYXO-CTERM domain-containing protein
MFNHTFIKRSLALALSTTAVAFPAGAQAFHIEGGPTGDPVQIAGPQSTVSAPVTQSSSSSFQWGDAGIGAGGAVLLLGASGLGAVAMRRRRPQRTLAS